MKKNNMNALVKNGYDVDFVNKQIKVTREFRELSGNCTSEAFKTMMTLREQLPGFEIVEVKGASRTVNSESGYIQGLTMEFMRVYLEDMYGEGSNQIRDFEKALELSKSRKSARYAYMKKWFNATYPDAIKLLGGIPDAERKAKRVNELHDKAKKALEAAKELKRALDKDLVNTGENLDATDEIEADLK